MTLSKANLPRLLVGLDWAFSAEEATRMGEQFCNAGVGVGYGPVTRFAGPLDATSKHAGNVRPS